MLILQQKGTHGKVCKSKASKVKEVEWAEEEDHEERERREENQDNWLQVNIKGRNGVLKPHVHSYMYIS